MASWFQKTWPGPKEAMVFSTGSDQASSVCYYASRTLRFLSVEQSQYAERRKSSLQTRQIMQNKMPSQEAELWLDLKKRHSTLMPRAALTLVQEIP